MEWISVVKQKPAEGSYVVVLYHQGGLSVAKYNGVHFSDDDLLVEDISHWLPLPPKPSEMFCYNYEDVEAEN